MAAILLGGGGVGGGWVKVEIPDILYKLKKNLDIVFKI